MIEPPGWLRDAASVIFNVDAVPPGLAPVCQPALHRSAVTAVDDAEDLTATGVHDRGHPALHTCGGGTANPPSMRSMRSR